MRWKHLDGAGNRDRKAESLTKVTVRLLALIGAALAGVLACYVWGIVENQKSIDSYIADTARLYVDQINRDISQINSEVFHVAGKDFDVEALAGEIGPKDGEHYELLTRLRDKMVLMKLRYGEVQFFFTYAREAGLMITDTGIVFRSSPVKLPINRQLLELLEADERTDSKYTDWTQMEIEGESYAVGYCMKKGKAVGCVVKLDTIFAQLQKAVEKYAVVPFLETADGNVLFPAMPEEEYAEIFREGRPKALYEFRLGTIGKLYLYIVPGGGITDNIRNMQLVLLTMVAALLVLCAIVISMYYRRIVEPMKKLVEGLENLEEGQYLDGSLDSRLLELQSVSGKFRELLGKLQSLRIAFYEKELKEQQIELEFMQEQMKPHFFINCLSLIHGMADRRGVPEIVGISEKLSEYIRHTFLGSGGTQRLVSEELGLLNSYVDIQKLRYGEDSFSFEVIEDGDVGGCKVPFLLLQILVENAIVHGVTLDGSVEVTLYITSEHQEEKDNLYICVSDTGQGFSAGILEAIEKDEPIVYNGRRHVGLQNIGKRLHLLYGDQAEIHFFNMDENFGAVVEVRLPRRL